MKKLLLSLLAFLLILEEWIWEWLTALGYRLSAWLHLLSFRWFARLHGSVTYWLGWARERIRATAVYRQARLIRQIALQRLSAWRRRLQPLESDSAGDRS